MGGWAPVRQCLWAERRVNGGGSAVSSGRYSSDQDPVWNVQGKDWGWGETNQQSWAWRAGPTPLSRSALSTWVRWGQAIWRLYSQQWGAIGIFQVGQWHHFSSKERAAEGDHKRQEMRRAWIEAREEGEKRRKEVQTHISRMRLEDLTWQSIRWKGERKVEGYFRF